MAKKKNTVKSLNAVYKDLYDLSTNNTAWMMNYNASEAAKSRNWSQYMSNTSHQREVADLKAAGLNPALSLNGGAASYTANSATSGVDSASNSLAQLAMTKANNATNLKLAKLGYKGTLASAAATRAAAAASAAGMTGAAAINSAATRYASDQAYNSAKYTADHQKIGTIERGVNYVKNKGLGGLLDSFEKWISKD